ncbi:MAG: class I SAM-dependent methyltransferase [Sulfuritalea sp.]|jgi:tellurite methyltransferase|nr:class I SAM-dependent methyltransferase [Sulfuritalea sp.]MDP1982585.1 class I SAM-dependent methyltransferase [Sulfuritalea sp.]
MAASPAIEANRSIAFFDRQFQQQVGKQDFQLNPFELDVLPHLAGRVLDFGCGLGNLAMAAAERGCSVLALDASPAAIEFLCQRAAAATLPIEAIEADLRDYRIDGDFDCVVSIGLLMFFNCTTSLRTVSMLQERVHPGGIAVINTLIEGTTYFDIFQPGSYCLLARDELRQRFTGWEILHLDYRDFEAPGQTTKSFVTLIARKPGPR